MVKYRCRRNFSGSGPAYIYLFCIEALSDGGVKMGLSRIVAANIAGLEQISG